MDSSWLCLDVEVNLRGARRSVSLFFLHVANKVNCFFDYAKVANM